MLPFSSSRGIAVVSLWGTLWNRRVGWFEEFEDRYGAGYTQFSMSYKAQVQLTSRVSIE